MPKFKWRKREDFVSGVIEHEDLVENQTPFRVTHPSMRNWTSMFEQTINAPVDPNYEKPEGRENFMFVPEGNADTIPGMVFEQFRRYAERDPSVTIGEAIKTFDQTGAKGKLKFLKDRGFNQDDKLQEILYQE